MSKKDRFLSLTSASLVSYDETLVSALCKNEENQNSSCMRFVSQVPALKNINLLFNGNLGYFFRKIIKPLTKQWIRIFSDQKLINKTF